MELRAKSRFDYETIKALVHLSLCGKHEPKKRFRVWLLLSGILASVSVLGMIVFRDGDMLLVACMAAVIFFCWCWLYLAVPKFRYKAMGNMRDAENEYIFLDHTLKARTEGKVYNGESEMEYSLFVKAFETSKYFFLYQTGNQVVVIDKSTVEGGSPADISSRISPFIKKYVICKY